MLGLTKEIRKQIGKEFGASIDVTVDKDEEERVIELPLDFTEALNANAEAKKTYDNLSYSGKKDYIIWITDAKKAETRATRVDKAVQMLAEGKKYK